MSIVRGGRVKASLLAPITCPAVLLQGFERAAELAPRRPDPAGVLAAWRPLAAAAQAAAGLAEQLSSTASALHLERVDVALSAADARQHMVEAAEGSWAAAGSGAPQPEGAALALAFAAFSEEQAAAVRQLQQQHEQLGEAADEPGEQEVAAEEGAAALLDGLQRLVLGYASTAVAVRDATSEALFVAADGSSLLGWLSEAVQAADSLSTTAAEVQLLLPQLLALLHHPTAAADVSALVSAAGEELAAADGGEDAASTEQVSAAAMQPLLEAAGRHPAVAGLLQGLQRVQAAAQLLLPAEERPWLAQQQLMLAGAAVGVWTELEEEAAAGRDEAGLPDSPPWQQCSVALAAAVAHEVARHLLPPLASALAATARQLRAAAPSLARLAAAAAASQPESAAHAGMPEAAAAELVPFSDFDSELPGAGMLLGGLEDELGAPGSPGAQPPGRQPGGDMDGRPELVPFLDFDEGLGGAGEPPNQNHVYADHGEPRCKCRRPRTCHAPLMPAALRPHPPLFR